MYRIAIVGAGAVGGALARRLVALGHRVTISNSRGPDSLRDVEKQTGAQAVDMAAAVASADFVVVAIPSGKIPVLGDALAGLLPAGAILIDVGNYYPDRDGHIAELDQGAPESAWVSRQFGRPVVKALNNIMADQLASAARASGSPDRVALPVAADDDKARSVVMALVEELGFDAFDAGSLDASWRQQPGQPAYCSNPTRKELPSLLDRADREKAPVSRDKGLKLMSRLPPNFPSGRLVKIARLSTGLDLWRPANWFAALALAAALIGGKADAR